jgi:HD-GYP domain-containing protein (c-di-GMP phosphodiesterase class II)
MDNNLEELQELEELHDLVEVLDNSTELTQDNNPGKSGLLSEASIVFRNAENMQNLMHSRIPAVILDIKLNIHWENLSYRSLFLNEERSLPVNIVKDFSTSLTPDKIGLIYKTLIDKNTGHSYKGKIESKHWDRLDIVANIIINPFTERGVIHREKSIPKFFIGIFDDISEDNKALLQKTFLSLLEASKLKDNDTGNHIKRVGEYSKSMAEKLFKKSEYPNVNAEFIDNIFFLAPMHDVGKIGTPDDILTKLGALNKVEWKIMKEHTINGAYILRAYPNVIATQIATFHHEKWNGNGYPYKISGKDIPLPARIVSISDVYDALRMKRSYKEPFTHEKAVEIITKDSGSHFDPGLVNIFIKYNDEFGKIYERLKDS